MEEFYADDNCPSKEELFDLKQRLKAELERIVDISGTILKTSRLTLREFEQTDLDDFHEYASVDGVGQMAGFRIRTKMKRNGFLTFSLAEEILLPS